MNWLSLIQKARPGFPTCPLIFFDSERTGVTYRLSAASGSGGVTLAEFDRKGRKTFYQLSDFPNRELILEKAFRHYGEGDYFSAIRCF